MQFNLLSFICCFSRFLNLENNNLLASDIRSFLKREFKFVLSTYNHRQLHSLLLFVINQSHEKKKNKFVFCMCNHKQL